MDIIEKIKSDLKQAILKKDELRRAVLRDLKSSIDNQAALKGSELNDEEIVQIIKDKITDGEEAIRDAAQANRQEIVSEMRTRLAIIQGYLATVNPQLGEAEVVAIIKATIVELSATEKPTFGDVLNSAMPKLRGRADGRLVSQLIRKNLGAIE